MLRTQVSGWGMELSEFRIEELIRYARLLSGYDEANVVGEREEGALVLHHVLDSLSCVLVPEAVAARSLIDVGSGGGLPGIPLAIALPNTKITLLEATGKKARFLSLAVEELTLDNVEVVNGRAEEIGSGEHRARYDVATSRAVASLGVVAEYCMPLLRVGGVAVAMKGDLSGEELETGKVAADQLGGRLREVLPVPLLPDLPDRRRSLGVLEKVEKTPEKYPRRPGLARKRPLGAQ